MVVLAAANGKLKESRRLYVPPIKSQKLNTDLCAW